MARRDSRNDIDITKEELNQISEALKKEEFRKLFIEYVDEINDPKNKAIFEKEITQYEKERGIDVTFIHPKPGYVIKTSVDGAKKAFINVCANDKIGKPSVARGFQEGCTGTEWSLPYIQAPPRDDLDKNRKLCIVYDVIFHPLTLELAKKDQRIKTFVNDTAVAAVENSFGVNLDKNNLKFPKMGFKGYKHACVIRKKASEEAGTSEGTLEDLIPNPHYPYSEPVSEPAVFTPKHEQRKDEYTTPKYHIKHRKNLDLQEFTYSNDAKMNTCVAHEILIEINLPLIKSTSDIEVLLSEKTLSLKSESPAKYKLEINLPYSIIDNESSAKFDASSRKLLVTAIVDRRKHCLTKEDSGLESDPSRGMSSSSDEDLSKLDHDTPVITNATDNIISQENEKLSTNDISDKEDYLSMDSPENMDLDMDIVEPFLSPDTYYSLPPCVLHKVSNSIIADLSATNVEPSSISHIFSENNSQFQIKFYSMGSGFVPINYTACLKLNGSSFQPVSLQTNVYDNSVSFSVSFSAGNDNEVGSVHFGRDLSGLQEVTLLEYNTTSETPSKAVSDFMNLKRKRAEDIVLKLSKLRLYSTADDDSDDFEEEEIFEDASVNDNVSVNTSSTQNNNKPPSPIRIDKKMRRTHSESGCSVPLIQRRSILKDTRSLSESSANDYAGFSVSMDSEDGTNENGHTKKQVRFSETISKKVFRANSSILGQRKKNQRKARNKKRSSERRNSESSGVSESEVSELEVSEVSDLSEVSDISETSESDDGSSFEHQVSQTPGPKAHRRKGKKNHRKSANTAKINCLFHNDA